MTPQSRVYLIISLFGRPAVIRFINSNYLGQIMTDSFNEELKKGKRKYKNFLGENNGIK